MSTRISPSSIFAVRILIMAGAVTALFVLAYLPRYLMDRKAKLNSNNEKAENSTEEKAECVETV